MDVAPISLEDGRFAPDASLKNVTVAYEHSMQHAQRYAPASLASWPAFARIAGLRLSLIDNTSRWVVVSVPITFEIGYANETFPQLRYEQP